MARQGYSGPPAPDRSLLWWLVNQKQRGDGRFGAGAGRCWRASAGGERPPHDIEHITLSCLEEVEIGNTKL